MSFSGLKIRTENASEMATETAKEIAADLDAYPLGADPLPSDLGDDMAYAPSPPPPPRKNTRPTTGPPTPLVTKQMEREVRDELQALVGMAALVWSVPDPHCGTVLSDQSKAIAESLVGVLKKNPRLLASLRAAGWFGDWVALFMALSPVLKAIYAHHLGPKEEEITDDGYDHTAPKLADFPAYLPRTGTGNATVA